MNIKPMHESRVTITKVAKLPSEESLKFTLVAEVTCVVSNKVVYHKSYTDILDNLEDIFDDAERWGKDMAQKLDVEYYL